MRQSGTFILLSACTASCSVLRRGNDTTKFDPLVYVDQLIGSANGGTDFAYLPIHPAGTSTNTPLQVTSLLVQHYRMVRTSKKTVSDYFVLAYNDANYVFMKEWQKPLPTPTATATKEASKWERRAAP
jgi:hypothetical protein